MHAARTKKGMKERRTPCSFSIRSLMRPRNASTALMSTSLKVVRCAVDCCASSKCSAMRLRRVDSFSRVSRSLAAPLAPAADGADAAGDGRGADGADGADGAAGAEAADAEVV